MNEQDRMNEIVGESGEAGEGCLVGLVKPVAVLTLMTAAVLTASPASAMGSRNGLVPRKPSPCTTVVPDTYGTSEQAARDVLGASGLTTYVWMNKEAGQWVVVYSSPEPGTTVNRCLDPLVEIWIGM